MLADNDPPPAPTLWDLSSTSGTSSETQHATCLERGSRICSRAGGDRRKSLLGWSSHVLHLEGPRSGRDVSSLSGVDHARTHAPHSDRKWPVPGAVVRSPAIRLVPLAWTHACQEPEARSTCRPRRPFCRLLPWVHRRRRISSRLQGSISLHEEGPIRLRAAVRVARVSKPGLRRLGTDDGHSARPCRWSHSRGKARWPTANLDASVREGRIDTATSLDVLRARRSEPRAKARDGRKISSAARLRFRTICGAPEDRLAVQLSRASLASGRRPSRSCLSLRRCILPLGEWWNSGYTWRSKRHARKGLGVQIPSPLPIHPSLTRPATGR